MNLTKKISTALTSFNLRLWPLILIGILALSALSIPRTIGLFKNISTDPIDLLPHENLNVQALLKVRDKLEKGVRTSIVFESDDPNATLQFLADTVEKLNHEPYVGRVIARKIGYDFFDKYKMLFIDLDDLRTIRDRIDRRIQKEKLGALYIDFEGEGDSVSFKDLEEKYGTSSYSEETKSEYNVSPDGKIYSIFVESGPESTGLSAASKFQDKMEAFVATLSPKAYHPTMKVYFSGATKVLEYRALIKDLKRVGIISGILLFIPLLIRFRNPIHVALIFLPLGVAMPIAFAAASFFVQKLNVSTSFLFAILGGLGVENGIHIFSRYYEDRTSGHERRHAINQIYEHTGRSILTSVASVAVTFLLLLINEFRGFSEFGLISGLGLIVIFIVYFTFMPSLMTLFEKIRVLRFHRKPPEEASLPVKAKWLTASLAVFAVFTVYSLIVTPFIGFEYDSKKTRAEIPEVIEAKKKQRMTTRRVNNPAAVVIYSREEAEALHEAVKARKEEDKLSPTIDASRSYYDLVPENQNQKLKVIGEIQNLMKDDTMRLVKGEQKKDLDRFRDAIDKTAPIKPEDVPPEVSEIFKGKPEVKGELFYINAIPELELDDGKNAMRFAEDVGTLETKAGVYHPSSDGVVYGIVLKTMLRDSKTVLLVSLLSVMFFVFIDFRSFKKTAIVMSSIVLGVVWLLGVIFFFKIKLNFYNMIIIPAVMGMSIDNSIHIYHRYEEMGRGSLAKVLGSTGLAAMLASLTNASGFFGLLFCVHKGLYSIGLLAVIGVATCFLSTLVFLPALLQLLEHLKFDKREVMP